MQLRDRFDPLNVSENDVVSAFGHSSKTTEMKYISIALRKKSGKFQKKNLIDFVFLHELAHVATPSKYLVLDGSVSLDDGMHTDVYWAVFAMILHTAETLGLYKPKDYSLHPEEYNNILFESNPYFNKDWLSIVSMITM